mgnify:CR=1
MHLATRMYTSYIKGVILSEHPISTDILYWFLFLSYTFDQLSNATPTRIVV